MNRISTELNSVNTGDLGIDRYSTVYFKMARWY